MFDLLVSREKYRESFFSGNQQPEVPFFSFFEVLDSHS